MQFFIPLTLFVFVINQFSGAEEDYYNLLGVSKDADNREIRRAFKKLALKLHPDKNTEDPDAHDKFIKITKVYEVLKDEEMRKKYDLMGEKGLEDDFGKGWRGSYQSWNYYSENFGIYDDDPEIITLSRTDFEQSVMGAEDVWFVNFYSPQCSHCHHVAPAWRALARELEGVIRVGAVNCEEEWMLCRQQHIQSYPSIIKYPERVKYHGSREAEAMVEYILMQLPYNVIELRGYNFKDLLSREEYMTKPWLISICQNDKECLFKDVLQKLSIILEGLVNVAKVEASSFTAVCKQLDCSAPVMFYSNMSSVSKEVVVHPISEAELKHILAEVLPLLPGAQKFTKKTFEKMLQDVSHLSSKPWLIHFSKRSVEELTTNKDTELKRLQALLPGVQLGHVDCELLKSVCSSLYLNKFPVFIVFKPGGTHEFHYGRFTSHDIASFVRESLSSRVHTLTPVGFSERLHDPKETWFVDFFAPWCPPCMQLLPEFRKASRSVGHLVKFGTVDCTTHMSLCNQYNIRAYPTTILYNNTVPHQFHGSHTMEGLEEFIRDILDPPVISLTPSMFDNVLGNKEENEMWVVDFYAPWCGPCQQLAPHWRRLARMLSDSPNIHVGQIDCQQYRSLCSGQGVNGYPTIRLYPMGSYGTSKFSFYNGWNRDANSLRAWVYNFLPSSVKSLSSSDFFRTLLLDSKPWIVDFFVPWCGHCQLFDPEFQKVAKALEGRVKAGKINCEQQPKVCEHATIQSYPTVVLYLGSEKSQTQNPIGIEIHVDSANDIIMYVERMLKTGKVSNKVLFGYEAFGSTSEKPSKTFHFIQSSKMQ